MIHDGYNMNHYKLFSFRVSGLIDHRPGGTADNKGFTLVELIVVVAIIAVMATIAFPAYTTYINKTRNARAKSEIRTLSTEISAYALDHGGTNPPDLIAIGRNNYLDPWHHPYVYTNIAVGGTALADAFSQTLNKDFDVYSKGPDNASAIAFGDPTNNDDIVRFNDGAFIGLR